MNYCKHILITTMLFYKSIDSYPTSRLYSSITSRNRSPYFANLFSPTPETSSISGLEAGIFAAISISVLSLKIIYGGMLSSRAISRRSFLSRSNSLYPEDVSVSTLFAFFFVLATFSGCLSSSVILMETEASGFLRPLISPSLRT